MLLDLAVFAGGAKAPPFSVVKFLRNSRVAWSVRRAAFFLCECLPLQNPVGSLVFFRSTSNHPAGRSSHDPCSRPSRWHSRRRHEFDHDPPSGHACSKRRVVAPVVMRHRNCASQCFTGRQMRSVWVRYLENLALDLQDLPASSPPERSPPRLQPAAGAPDRSSARVSAMECRVESPAALRAAQPRA